VRWDRQNTRAPKDPNASKGKHPPQTILEGQTIREGRKPGHSLLDTRMKKNRGATHSWLFASHQGSEKILQKKRWRENQRNKGAVYYTARKARTKKGAQNDKRTGSPQIQTAPERSTGSVPEEQRKRTKLYFATAATGKPRKPSAVKSESEGETVRKTRPRSGGGVRTKPPGVRHGSRERHWTGSREVKGKKKKNGASMAAKQGTKTTQTPTGILTEKRN